MNWYFVRHGEIAANLKKIYAGPSPERLTSRGLRQAAMMAEKLLPLGIDRIYCSPVARAVQTAEIIGDILGKQPIQATAFREISLGPWQGKSETEVQSDFPQEWQLWNTRPAELVMEGRETLAEVFQRVLKGMALIQTQNNYHSVLVVSHVAIIRVIMLHWQGLDFNLYRTLPVPHGKIFSFAGLGNLP
jgi:broad specificity phosphatase PhoE